MKKYICSRGIRYTSFLLTILVLLSSILLVTYAADEKIVTKPLDLSIIHFNDRHSHLESSSYDLNLGGETTRVAIGSFPKLITRVKELKKEYPNSLTIEAGDALVGSLYYTLFKGEADAALTNLVGLDAFTLGNHEFDDGDKGLHFYLSKLKNVPVISANVTAQKGNILYEKWTPYVIKEVAGEKVGIIGIDIVRKTIESSNPSKEILFSDEIKTAQKYAYELEKAGINKIIVVSHWGYKNDLRMAEKTEGIDIIVGGDSHTALGTKNNLGVPNEGPYPSMVSSLRGDNVAVVQSWEYSKAVGRVSVSFDELGVVKSAKGYSTLLLADSFLRKNADGDRVEIEGSAREAVYEDIKNSPLLTVVKDDEKALKVLNKYSKKKKKFADEVIGTAAEFIPGGSALRIPSPQNPMGSFSAYLSAEAFLNTFLASGQGSTVDFVVQNAGGVRTEIPEGKISYNTAYELLPFSNTLYVLYATGAQVKQSLEEAVSSALNPETSTGSFPYTAGLRFSVDLSTAARDGNRISNIEVQNEKGWVSLDMKKTYSLGTNSYIAGGKDGYKTFGTLYNKGLDTYLDYAESFVNYVKKTKSISKPATTNVKAKF